MKEKIIILPNKSKTITFSRCCKMSFDCIMDANSDQTNSVKVILLFHRHISIRQWVGLSDRERGRQKAQTVALSKVKLQTALSCYVPAEYQREQPMTYHLMIFLFPHTILVYFATP